MVNDISIKRYNYIKHNWCLLFCVVYLVQSYTVKWLAEWSQLLGSTMDNILIWMISVSCFLWFVPWSFFTFLIAQFAGGKYGHVVIPHYANGCFYSRWIDFKLRIYNATESDSGIYTFRATDLYGHSHEQIIYVDISEQKRKRSQKRHPSIQRLRQQIRPFAKSSAESEKSEGSSKEHLPEQEEVMKIKERKE